MKERLKQSSTLQYIRRAILSIIDFFYPPFKGFFTLKTFRYAFCGGGVALLNLLVFAFSNHFIVDEREPVDIGFIHMQYYTVSFIIAFCTSFPIGFVLNKYVVFQTSNLKGRVQLFRYAIMTGVNIFLNYTFLHLLVGIWEFWSLPSQVVITIVLAALSYLAQNFFSFRESKNIQKKNESLDEGFIEN